MVSSHRDKLWNIVPKPNNSSAANKQLIGQLCIMYRSIYIHICSICCRGKWDNNVFQDWEYVSFWAVCRWEELAVIFPQLSPCACHAFPVRHNAAQIMLFPLCLLVLAALPHLSNCTLKPCALMSVCISPRFSALLLYSRLLWDQACVCRYRCPLPVIEDDEEVVHVRVYCSRATYKSKRQWKWWLLLDNKYIFKQVSFPLHSTQLSAASVIQNGLILGSAKSFIKSSCFCVNHKLPKHKGTGEKWRIHVSVNRLLNHPWRPNEQLSTFCWARLAGTLEKKEIWRNRRPHVVHALPWRILLSTSSVTFDLRSVISHTPVLLCWKSRRNAEPRICR